MARIWNFFPGSSLMRVFSLLLLLVLALPVMLRAAEGSMTDAVNNPEKPWQDLQDFEESVAFDQYGPPIKEDAKKFQEQTSLYLDMLADFDEISDDEDDFAFVAEAYRVPTSEFRPASLRPGEGGGDELFDDDPLPSKIQSTSVYVDTVRQSVLPGPAIKPKNMDEVKLGENLAKPLFAEPEKPKPKEKPKEEVKQAEKPKAKPGDKPGASEASNAYMKAGRINAPPQAAGMGGAQNAASHRLSPDEETLMALKNAVKELGLEKQLNFEGGMVGNQAVAQQSGTTQASAEPAPAAKPELAQAQRHQVKPKKKKKKKIRKIQPPVQEEEQAAPAPEEKKEDKDEGFSLF